MDVHEGQKYNRGDIYFVEDAPSVGSEQYGNRPAVIVGNDKGNMHASVVEIIYLTTKHKHSLPTHVMINSSPRSSTALCEHVHTVSKDRLGQKLGSVSHSEMREIEGALSVGLGMHRNGDSLVDVFIKTAYAEMAFRLGVELFLSMIQLLHEFYQEKGTAVLYMEAALNGGPVHGMSFRMEPDSLSAAMQEIIFYIAPKAEEKDPAREHSIQDSVEPDKTEPMPDAGEALESLPGGPPENTGGQQEDTEREGPEDSPLTGRVHIPETLYLASDNRKDEAKEYKGFLLAKCRYCGEIKGFCASKPVSEFMCRCGRNTSLVEMKPLFLDCACGQHFRYMTNITDPEFSYHCMNCGREVKFKLNKAGTAYNTKKSDPKSRRRSMTRH